MGKRKGILQIGIRAKVLTLSLDGPVERSLDRECEEKLGLKWPISDPGLLRSVKEILDEFLLKLRRYGDIMKLQLVRSMTIGRQVSTPRMLEPSDMFGRESEPLQLPDLENVHEV